MVWGGRGAAVVGRQRVSRQSRVEKRREEQWGCALTTDESQHFSTSNYCLDERGYVVTTVSVLCVSLISLYSWAHKSQCLVVMGSDRVFCPLFNCLGSSLWSKRTHVRDNPSRTISWILHPVLFAAILY